MFRAWLLNTIAITPKSEDKYVVKVFNPSEFHFSEMTFFQNWYFTCPPVLGSHLPTPDLTYAPGFYFIFSSQKDIYCTGSSAIQIDIYKSWLTWKKKRKNYEKIMKKSHHFENICYEKPNKIRIKINEKKGNSYLGNFHFRQANLKSVCALVSDTYVSLFFLGLELLFLTRLINIK